MTARVPLTLWLYVGVWVVFTPIGFVVDDVEDGWLYIVIASLVVAALLFVLLRGSRIAWVLFVLLELLALVAAVIEDDQWWLWVPVSLTGIALLFAPATRRHVRLRRS